MSTKENFKGLKALDNLLWCGKVHTASYSIAIQDVGIASYTQLYSSSMPHWVYYHKVVVAMKDLP